jgi:hypothetical protein
VQLNRHVASHRGSPSTAAEDAAAARAEEGFEEVADRAELVEVGLIAPRSQTLVTKAVVGSAALRIRENLVGLGSLLEPLSRVGILGVDVGV